MIYVVIVVSMLIGVVAGTFFGLRFRRAMDNVRKDFTNDASGMFFAGRIGQLNAILQKVEATSADKVTRDSMLIFLQKVREHLQSEINAKMGAAVERQLNKES